MLKKKVLNSKVLKPSSVEPVKQWPRGSSVQLALVHLLVLVPVLVLVHVLVLVFVLEHALLGFGSTNTVLPTVLGQRQPVVLEGVTALPTEPATAGHAADRLHQHLRSVQGLLADPLLLEEGLLKNALHPRC